MAGNIKGITIEIGGETTKLQKALTDVNKKSKDIQNELKQVEKLLKLDPKNTELHAQKQKLLADPDENSKEKLNKLKTAQSEVTEQLKKGEISEEQYGPFSAKVAKAEQDLEKFERATFATVTTTETWQQKLTKASIALKNDGAKMTSVGKDLAMKVTRLRLPLLGRSY
jgi:phage-related minor tail protein